MFKEKLFRVWDVEKGKMRGDFFIDSAGRIYIDGHMEGPADPSKFILMEYAGIKDKNGKPVFEGDIFRAPHDFGPGGFSERTAVCGWVDDEARGYQWNYWLLEDLEVIGNKYENPDMCSCEKV